MKVLVTGGSGFIGSWVVNRAIAEGMTPIIFDTRWRPGYPEGAEMVLGDIRDQVSVTEAFARVDMFVHLAAVLGTQETIKNPTPAAMTNIKGGLNILEAAAQYDVPGVYIGVGNHWMENTYSISKTTVERFIRMYNKERGTRVNVVRCVNAYGPGQVPAPPYGPSKVRKITPSFVCRALRGDPIEIYGDGWQVSDMVYVQDVAKVLLLSALRAERGEVFSRAIEVGPAESRTVNDIAQLIVAMTESESEIVHIPMRPGEEPGATVKAECATLNFIGMRPFELTPLSEGMDRTIEYFRDYLA